MHYAFLIEWSDVDHCYGVTLPEWAEHYAMPCGDGRTYDEALQSAKDALATIITLTHKYNARLPAPMCMSTLKHSINRQYQTGDSWKFYQGFIASPTRFQLPIC